MEVMTVKISRVLFFSLGFGLASSCADPPKKYNEVKLEVYSKSLILDVSFFLFTHKPVCVIAYFELEFYPSLDILQVSSTGPFWVEDLSLAPSNAPT